MADSEGGARTRPTVGVGGVSRAEVLSDILVILLSISVVVVEIV